MPLLTNGLIHQFNLAGNLLRGRYYTETIQGGGSVWDDTNASSFAKSGADLYFSGIILKIDATRGSEDQVLLEQGRVRYDDSKIFVNGSVQTTSGARVFTFAISGLDRVYREIEQGVNMPQYFGMDVYKKVYCRIVDGGSLF